MYGFLVGLAVLLAIVTWPSAASAQEECLGGAETPEDAASVLFADLLANGQWDHAYEMLHPEAQLRVVRQAFAAARQARAVTGPLLDVEVFPSRSNAGYVWGVTGVRYADVAEVPVRFVRGRGFGVVPTIEMVPLIRFEGCWRWLPPQVP